MLAVIRYFMNPRNSDKEVRRTVFIEKEEGLCNHLASSSYTCAYKVYAIGTPTVFQILLLRSRPTVATL